MSRCVAVALALAMAACSSKDTSPGPVAEELADGLSAAITVAEKDSSPVLCAVLPTARTSAELALEDGSSLSVTGERIAVELAGDRKPRVAVVSDARGASAQVSGEIDRLVKAWKRDDVSVVFVLGGMAQTADVLLEMLSPMVTRNRALIAAPGDRENVAELDKAIATLRDRGLPAFSTTAIRLVTIDGVAISVLPGVANEVGLVSGGDGCLHREEDAAALATLLGSHEGPRVWLSYAAPRQTGDVLTATDLSSGVHAGEPELRAAIASSRPQLVLHGQIEPDAPAPTTGDVDRKATVPTFVAVGFIEALPDEHTHTPAGVVLEALPARLKWWRPLDVAPSR